MNASVWQEGCHKATGLRVAVKVIDKQIWRAQKGGLRDDQLLAEYNIQRGLRCGRAKPASPWVDGDVLHGVDTCLKSRMRLW